MLSGLAPPLDIRATKDVGCRQATFSGSGPLGPLQVARRQDREPWRAGLERAVSEAQHTPGARGSG